MLLLRGLKLTVTIAWITSLSEIISCQKSLKLWIQASRFTSLGAKQSADLLNVKNGVESTTANMCAHRQYWRVAATAGVNSPVLRYKVLQTVNRYG